MAQPAGALSQNHYDYYHCLPSILPVLVQGAGLGETCARMWPRDLPALCPPTSRGWSRQPPA
eukprot:3940751-Pyramimonas_sp.AAC.1